MKRLFNVEILFIILMFGLSSCKDKPFSFNSNLDEIESMFFYLSDSLNLNISSSTHKINSIEVLINDIPINFSKKIPLDSTYCLLGINFLFLKINHSDGKQYSMKRIFKIYSSTEEKLRAYKVLQKIPHNQFHFTQGFEVYHSMIYEGVGQYGQSKIIKYTLSDFKLIKEIKNSDDVFGEGITVFHNKIYQLTWRNKKVFIYDLDLNFIREIPYPPQLKEGWGICNDGKQMYISSEERNTNLIVVDQNFKFLKSIPIVGNNKIYFSANELEFSNGKIYANIWKQNIIIVIDPKTGKVTDYYDFTELVNENQIDEESVLNGIAYLSGNIFLIGGKNWKFFYKVEL